MPEPIVAFIGGGNMAAAIVGGLVGAGRDPASMLVVEPSGEQRARLSGLHRVSVFDTADARLAAAGIVVWAVKPQTFCDAARPAAPHVGSALHVSVMAGIRSDAIARAVATERIVRAMPNTPALIGRGIAGLYARDAVSASDRRHAEQVLASTGALLWVEREADLDAVTALSGSGPAYVFYLVEAMVQAAREMGLPAEHGKALALATFAGAAELAARSSDAPEVLRERVTSKGGTTAAALASLDADRVKAAFVKALHAARERARELGDEFG